MQYCTDHCSLLNKGTSKVHWHPHPVCGTEHLIAVCPHVAPSWVITTRWGSLSSASLVIGCLNTVQLHMAHGAAFSKNLSCHTLCKPVISKMSSFTYKERGKYLRKKKHWGRCGTDLVGGGARKIKVTTSPSSKKMARSGNPVSLND